MYIQHCTLNVLKSYLIDDWTMVIFWIPVIAVTDYIYYFIKYTKMTNDIKLPTQAIKFLDKQNILSQWWEYILVHSHKPTRGQRCTNVHVWHELRAPVHGAHMNTHTWIKYLPFNKTLCFTSFFVCWWRAWACWQTVQLAGRGLKHVFN
jgi:hypothetical protein